MISFPCSMKMTSESKEVNELNQCYGLASAGRKEQSGSGEWFTAGSWAELTAWPGWCKRRTTNGSMELPETPSFPENKNGQLLCAKWKQARLTGFSIMPNPRAVTHKERNQGYRYKQQ